MLLLGNRVTELQCGGGYLFFQVNVVPLELGGVYEEIDTFLGSFSQSGCKLRISFLIR